MIILLPVSIASASEFPAIKDNVHVYDEMNVVSEQTENIVNSVNRQLKEHGDGAEIMIATISDLAGKDAFTHSVDFYNNVTIGSEKKDNGVLIFLARDEIEAKEFIEIRTGYGLEGALTDGRAGAIIDSAMMDNIKNKDFDIALRQGFLEVSNAISEEYNIELSISDTYNFESAVDYEEPGLTTSPLIIKIVIAIAGILILLTLITGNPIFIDILFFALRIFALSGSSSSSSISSSSSRSSGSSRSGGRTGGGGAGRST